MARLREPSCQSETIRGRVPRPPTEQAFGNTWLDWIARTVVPATHQYMSLASFCPLVHNHRGWQLPYQGEQFATCALELAIRMELAVEPDLPVPGIRVG